MTSSYSSHPYSMNLGCMIVTSKPIFFSLFCLAQLRKYALWSHRGEDEKAVKFSFPRVFSLGTNSMGKGLLLESLTLTGPWVCLLPLYFGWLLQSWTSQTTQIPKWSPRQNWFQHSTSLWFYSDNNLPCRSSRILSRYFLIY